MTCQLGPAAHGAQVPHQDLPSFIPRHSQGLSRGRSQGTDLSGMAEQSGGTCVCAQVPHEQLV
eukprot:CAMPEP_0202920890 /NCGR_PEP_ID=MMETSP1392-20130828/77097_1 /ASSEMBLY_ACC=CAM_ASM_000868 /TAXON_ID=225041 /ORGANISM="Chlamydomonas chlamydogama, Strain SAG 11-48b" /LENGTH=62 /DNA_ID=CAMNT_0049614409 /DNA_START=381 /DNA_END=569 /DNA_ORIENTATION=+